MRITKALLISTFLGLAALVGIAGPDAKCHGDAGQGTKDAPAVVGKDVFPLDPRPKAKRDVKFHTAADVFAWARKHMPAKKPGSLTQDQYLAIFAFDLNANGVKLDKPLDGNEGAAKIALHP